jgi:6,7-dimethyl-8-ribityllumazine synthase
MSQDPPTAPTIDATGLRIAIVASRYNQQLVNELLKHALVVLDGAKVGEEDIETVRVPGANEIPYAAAMLAKSGEFDCVICLGVVVAGDTPHHDIIGRSTANALHKVGCDTEVPVINGIVVTLTREQAEARCGGAHNRGAEFARAALEMADLKRRLVHRLDQIEKANQQADGSGYWDAFEEEDDEGESWKL